MTQRGRQPQSDYWMPRDAGLNAASNPASNLHTRSSQAAPNSAERSVRINNTPSHTVLISCPLFIRLAEHQRNVHMHRRHRYPVSNVLTQVLLIAHPLQRLPLPLPTITQLVGQVLFSSSA